MTDFVVVSIAYLTGSIPFAFLLARRNAVDLRVAGSGNVGATNALRTSGVRIAVLAMALDALKGTAAVVLAQRLAPGSATPVVAGLAAIVGHVYPVFLRFHGGKGVATAAGVFGVLAPGALAMACAVFIAVVWMTRFVSAGSMAAAVALAATAAAGSAPALVTVGAAIAATLVLVRHRANLRRLLAGTEPRASSRRELAGTK